MTFLLLDEIYCPLLSLRLVLIRLKLESLLTTKLTSLTGRKCGGLTKGLLGTIFFKEWEVLFFTNVFMFFKFLRWTFFIVFAWTTLCSHSSFVTVKVRVFSVYQICFNLYFASALTPQATHTTPLTQLLCQSFGQCRAVRARRYTLRARPARASLRLACRVRAVWRSSRRARLWTGGLSLVVGRSSEEAQGSLPFKRCPPVASLSRRSAASKTLWMTRLSGMDKLGGDRRLENRSFLRPLKECVYHVSI